MVISKIKNKLKQYIIKIKFFFMGRLLIKFPNSIMIQSPLITLNDISEAIDKKQRGAYMRFGDGDINLLLGIDDLLQHSSKDFQEEMKEAFNLRGNNLYKCLPIHSNKFGKEPDMKPGYHSASDKWAISILHKCFEYFIGQKIYSHVALSYIAVSDDEYTVKFLNKIKSLNPIFIGNKDIKINIIQKILSARSHIKTDPKFSYGDIDRIEQESLKVIESSNDDFILIVIAMGCAGRVLQKRLLTKTKKNIFIFDFGSLLDIFNGDETRAWMSKELSDKNEQYWSNLMNKIN